MNSVKEFFAYIIVDHATLFWSAYLLTNLISLALYAIDKACAKLHVWRIRESVLLFSAFFGGIGALLGMFVFRHKTRHIRFLFFVPLALILQLALILTAFLA